jgi:CPA2 family monovalent cation:H+ antiporter-2
MHELPLLTNLALALVAALVGGLVARRLGLPAIVGYLTAGVAIGPGTPGFAGDPDTISQLAEIGIVLLMFGVGLHFSFRELWRVRSVAIPGAVLQMLLSTALGYAVARAWGWSTQASLLIGVAISIASTIVLIRALMDRGLLDSRRGHTAVGWLVLEDIATVAALVLLPVAAGAGTGAASGLEVTLWAVGKAVLFVALMTIAGVRVVPWLLARIARTRSQELFVLGALAVALGVALASAELFGVSLALGAFVAGAVVRGSRYGHQVSADLVPFRDAFSVLFFVSVGMLVDLAYVRDHVAEIAALSALVIGGKAAIAAGLTYGLSRSAPTALTVAAGLAQIGEFSFIVGQAGVSLGVLHADQYSILPAVAVVSIVSNPLVFRVAEAIERRIPERAGERGRDVPDALADHVVVVGHGRVGRHVIDVLEGMGIPVLVVDEDDSRIDALEGRRLHTLLGNAASSELLRHAALPRARALIVAVADPVATEIIVGRAHDLAPSLRIVARASSHEGAEPLARAGATVVVDPQLEGAIEMLRRVLLLLDVPLVELHRRVDALRDRQPAAGDGRHRILDDLVRATRELELRWVRVPEDAAAVGATLSELDLGAKSGASCVAIARGETLVTRRVADVALAEGDALAMIGASDQLGRAAAILARGARPGSASPEPVPA